VTRFLVAVKRNQCKTEGSPTCGLLQENAVPTSRLKAIALICALITGASSHAFADPFTITSGSVQANTSLSLARIRMAGDGFTFSGATEDFNSDLWSCKPCEPAGVPVSLGATWRPTGVNGARAVVNGVAFDDVVFGPGTSGTFTTAALTLSGSSPLTVSTPFSFSGVIRGFSSTQFDDLLFTATVQGRGTARAQFTPFDAAGQTLFYNVELPGQDYHLEYVFSELAPRPEPATALLIGAVVLFVGAYRRRQPRVH
jgi:hypothetical protein